MSEPIQVPARLLAAAGEAICGNRWQSDLARELGVNLRLTQRWAQAAREDRPYPIQRTLLEELLGLLERRTRPARDAFEHLKLFYDGLA